jgi:hypothetical protein
MLSQELLELRDVRVGRQRAFDGLSVPRPSIEKRFERIELRKLTLALLFGARLDRRIGAVAVDEDVRRAARREALRCILELEFSAGLIRPSVRPHVLRP